jgi:hypothetical protein
VDFELGLVRNPSKAVKELSPNHESAVGLSTPARAGMAALYLESRAKV